MNSNADFFRDSRFQHHHLTDRDEKTTIAPSMDSIGAVVVKLSMLKVDVSSRHLQHLSLAVKLYLRAIRPVDPYQANFTASKIECAMLTYVLKSLIVNLKSVYNGLLRLLNKILPIRTAKWRFELDRLVPLEHQIAPKLLHRSPELTNNTYRKPKRRRVD